jgi:hypothetical protein
VEENPGKRSGFVAHILGLPRSKVSRSLPAMNDHGYLLSEDDKGRLCLSNPQNGDGTQLIFQNVAEFGDSYATLVQTNFIDSG